MTLAAFEECFISVSVCGGDIIAASWSIEPRRESTLGVAEALCDFDREGGGGTPKSPKPDEVRTDLVREGVFDILSEPDDLDMTSLSRVELVRTDFVRTRPGFGPVATLVDSSPDLVRVAAGFFAEAPPPQKPQDPEAALRLTLARSFFGEIDLGAGTGSGGGVGGLA
jgi:hypothetical protein